MPFKALVFDLGNVVVHFDHARTTSKLAAHTSLPRSELEDILYRGTLSQSYERGEVTTDAFRAQVKHKAALKCDDDFFDQAYADIFWANEPLTALLPSLAMRWPLYLLSNTNDLHATQFRREHAAALSHFRTLYLSHEIGKRKPELRVFDHVAAEIGLSPTELLFFDDLPANIEAARSRGWNGIVYRNNDDVTTALF